MKTYYSFLGNTFAFTDDNGCDWYRADCGIKMNCQYDSTSTDNKWTCPECGYVNDDNMKMYCMKDNEIDFFIEEMKRYGDIWDADDVRRVYRGFTLEEALKDSISCLKDLYDIVKVIYEPRESESEEKNNE